MIWVTLSSVLLCCVGLGKRIMKQCHCSAFEGWDSKTAYARAFKIGQAEAGAVKNLRCNVSKETLTQLQEAVRLRGVARFVTHDLVSKSCFNEAWTSGIGVMEQWAVPLTNMPNGELVARPDWKQWICSSFRTALEISLSTSIMVLFCVVFLYGYVSMVDADAVVIFLKSGYIHSIVH